MSRCSSQSDLEQGDLARFDAIVAGVRAYNVRPDVRANQPRLMDYVENGGTYVVQYQTGTGGRGPGGPPAPAAGARHSNIGPYPITIPAGNGYRVTVEEAPVTFPHADSRLLQAPNHISEKDFQGWVQERGLNFATKWDPQYQTVLGLARSRRTAARRRRTVDPLRQGRLHFHRLLLVPAVARGRAGRVSPVRQSTEREIARAAFRRSRVQSKLRTACA